MIRFCAVLVVTRLAMTRSGPVARGPGETWWLSVALGSVQLGFAGQRGTLVVDDVELVFLDEPPGHEMADQAIQRVRGDQHAR